MFDPYRKWLGIPEWEQPPNHYRLLGINLFEDDPDVIETAADRQMGHIRNYQAGKHSALSQRLLNELSAARICLLNLEKKKAYDEKLRTELAVRRGDSVLAGPPFGFFVRGAARYFGVVARQFWLGRFVLPGAYAALGRDIVSQGRYRDRMPELYARLEALTHRLAELQAKQPPAVSETPGTSEAPEAPQPPDAQQPPRTLELPATPEPPEPAGPAAPAGPPEPPRPPAGASGTASGTASEPVVRASALKRAMRWLTMRAKWAYFCHREASVLREIARRAWDIDHEQAGPIERTARVRKALTGIEECRAEVRTLSEIPPEQWLSPKRLAWIVLATLGLIVTLYLWLRWRL